MSFNNLEFSINQHHPASVHSTLGAKCLICLTDVYSYQNVELPYSPSYPNATAKTCKCSNVGLTLDDDSTVTFYVDDLNTIHMGYYFFNKDNSLLNTEWLAMSSGHLCMDYTDVSNQASINTHKDDYVSKWGKKSKNLPKAKYITKIVHGVTLQFDKELMDALDKYKNYTA